MKRMPVRILMVCLGNICRSPLAEGILKKYVDSDWVFVASAGTASYHVGAAPDKRSVAIGLKNGVDIGHQRARMFSINDFDVFDHIYVMDDSNYKDVIALAPNKKVASKVELILNHHPDTSAQRSVPDPYYGGADGFELVYDLLDKACIAIAESL